MRIGPEDDTVTTQLDLYWRELLAVLLWFRRAKRGAAPESRLPSPEAARYERLLSLVRI